MDVVQGHYVDPIEGYWENSDERIWMNSTFYETAFDDTEKDIILLNYLKDVDRNVIFIGRDGELAVGDFVSETDDKVFALSLPEVKKYINGGDCRHTKYAVAKYDGVGSKYWVLRTMSTTGSGPVCVGLDHNIYNFVELLSGVSSNHYNVGVRPAIWISIDAATE